MSLDNGVVAACARLIGVVGVALGESSSRVSVLLGLLLLVLLVLPSSADLVAVAKLQSFALKDKCPLSSLLMFFCCCCEILGLVSPLTLLLTLLILLIHLTISGRVSLLNTIDLLPSPLRKSVKPSRIDGTPFEEE